MALDSVEPPTRFSVAFVGAPDVGKSSIIYRTVTGCTTLPDTPLPAFAQKTKIVELPGASRVELLLHDTEGQERFRAEITIGYLRGMHAVVVVYDTTREATFAHVDRLLKELRVLGVAEAVPFVYLVGNKTDLAAARAVASEAGAAKAHAPDVPLCNGNELIFFETSAATGSQIEPLMEDIASRLLAIAVKNRRASSVGGGAGGRSRSRSHSLASPDDSATGGNLTLVASPNTGDGGGRRGCELS